ncbi:MAG: ABC transporter substrate-binding protein [Nitriliruptor sp.]|uniref:ABC transporter substrate-binding protein n=1 Tax=Nitriliruptor sp. TaxID=2448056 RepID=UPI0034A07FC3
MSRRTLRALAAPLALALTIVACGQKPGVHVERGPLAAGGGQGAVDEEGFPIGDEEFLEDGEFALGEEGDLGGEGDLDGSGAVPGDPSDPASGGGDGSGGDGGGGDGSGGDGGGGDGGGGDGGDGGGGKRGPRGSDRTGVTDDAITLAVHAPVTGAAPLPATSFEKARDLYWRWVIEEKGQKVLGRSKVNVIFADDKYEPSNARQVCRQLASRAFSLTGGGGTDQIQACGQWAGQARVPYSSAGVTEAGLAGNPWYFAASMSYKQQGPLLAQYVKKNFSGQKTAAIVTQTRNFDDAVAGWEGSLSGIDYEGTLRHPKGDTSWYGTYARQLGQANVKVIYMLTSPLDYIRFAQTAKDQGYDFQYVGVGITKGLNAVLNSGCPHVGKGTFLSPFPALETADKLDPDFRKAAAKFNVPIDDIAWAIWGTAKMQHELFKKYESIFGTDLTREDYREVVANAGKVSTGVFPDVNFSPNNNFGSTGVHVLKADCGSRTYKDGGTFKSGF